jgi:integrase
MTTYNAENERAKRRYFTFQSEAKQRSEASIDAIAMALNRFEVYTRFKSFRAFRIEQAINFKNHLARQVNARTNEPLSKATAYSTLAALKAFFQWLSREPGFKKRLNYSDADYFSLSLKDTAIAKAANEERIPTLDQIRHVIEAMPSGTDIEKRNRALIAFILLTGVRDNAVASMRLKHVDLADGKILQDARQVRTKFSKTFTTYFFPLARTFLPFLPNGWHFCKRSGFGGSTIRSFRRRASRLVRAVISKSPGSIGNVGQTPHRFGRFSERLSREWGSGILIPIHSVRPSPCSGRRFARRRRNSRLGRKTLGMKVS